MSLWLLSLCAALAGHAPPVEGARSDGRPHLSGTVQFLDSDDGFFRVHYTTEGLDAVTGGDEDADGMPDKVTRALDALVAARALYAAEGWRALIGDNGTGGSAGIDVYLQQVDINGYAHGVEVSGEQSRGSCWIEVDNAVSDAGRIFESVVTHELHHCVQYRYTWEGASWVFEGTATFEQYRAVRDGALGVGLAALYFQRLTQPELPIDSRFDDYEYAAFLFFKFWRELGGVDEQRLPALWEALSAEPDWTLTLDTHGQQVFGQPFDVLFLEHATWNAFACGRDDAQHYDPDAVGCEWGTSVPVAEVTLGEPFPVALDANYSAAYVSVAGQAGATVALACDPLGERAELGVNLVDVFGGARVDTASAWAQPGTALSATLTDEVAEQALAVFASTERGAVDLECTFTLADAAAPDPDAEQDGGCDSAPSRSNPWLVLGILVVAARRRGVLSAARKPWR